MTKAHDKLADTETKINKDSNERSVKEKEKISIMFTVHRHKGGKLI